MATVISAVLILLGAALAVIGGIGLQRFPDVFARLHVATKPATLGLVCILTGAAIRVGSTGDAAKLLLVVILQFFTAPIGAHMMGRAAYGAGTELSPDTLVDELGDALGQSNVRK